MMEFSNNTDIISLHMGGITLYQRQERWLIGLIFTVAILLGISIVSRIF